MLRPVRRICAGLLKWLPLRGKRGATSVLFAMGAVGTLGLAGLASEGGSWYMQKRQGQNAADAAATFAAVTLGNTSSATSAVAGAVDVATRNGFTAGQSGTWATTVTTNVPPTTGTHTGDPTAVEVIIARTQPPLLSRLVLSDNITIRTRSVAASVGNGGLSCVLTLKQSLSIAGNTNVPLNNCVLTSNATGNNSISINGNPTVSVASLQASGGCNNCTGSNITLQRPPSIYQPPTPDPFKAKVQSVVLPSFSGNTCTTTPAAKGVSTLLPTSVTGKAYCTKDLQISTGDTVNLVPGTYFFWNTNIKITGGSLQCPTCTGSSGVTIIFTGNPAANIGGISIGGGATVTLQAPAVNAWNANFDGILFYRDVQAPAGNPGVSVNAGSNVTLAGGLYFPSTYVKFSGNMTVGGVAATTCLVLVAAQVDLTGNSGFASSGCGAGNTAVAQLASIRVVE